MKNFKLTSDYLNLPEYFYSKVNPSPLLNPKLISYNYKLCKELELSKEDINSNEFTNMINGSYLPKGGEFFANAYAGHQFGYFVPQLGDGRAINLGKTNNYNLQLKGSGITPYSRNGDGRAVLRSSIREYLLSEAMYALGIPTTRALAIINSDSTAYREGNEPCSIVIRASSSWIRFGSFEYAYVSQNAKENLEALCNFTINESYPHLKNEKNKYEKMYFEVVDKTIDLMVHWQSVGFMHGVMNTDNMSIDGLTIDYGPFAFMEEFRDDFICNRSDHEGRYSFSNQPFIAQWNLSVLASVLEPIASLEVMNEYNDSFIGKFKEKYYAKMSNKFGIEVNDENTKFILDMLIILENCSIDYTVFFYYLSKENYQGIINMASSKIQIQESLEKLKSIIKLENKSNRLNNMLKINPKYILKNYMLQEVIDSCQNGEYKLLNDMLNIAQNPFDEHEEYEKYSKPTPKSMSTLICSCSS